MLKDRRPISTAKGGGAQLTIQHALGNAQFHNEPRAPTSSTVRPDEHQTRSKQTILSRRLLADGVLMSHAHCSGPYYDDNEGTDDVVILGAPVSVGSSFRFPAWPRPCMANRHGTMHGGLIAATLDTLIGVHLYLALGAPEVFPAVTVHLQLEYLKPVHVMTVDTDRRDIASVPVSTSVAQWGCVFHTKLIDIADDHVAHFNVWVTKGRIITQPRLVSGTATAMIVRRRQSKM